MTHSSNSRVISRIIRNAPYDDLQRQPYYQPFSLNIIPEITFYFTPKVYEGNAVQGTATSYHYSSELVNLFYEIFQDNTSSQIIANRNGLYLADHLSNAEYIRIASEIDIHIALSRFAIVAYSLAYLLQASGKSSIALSLAPKFEQVLINNNPYGLHIRPEVFANARKIYEMTLVGEFSPESLLNIINDTKVLDANLVMLYEDFSLKNIIAFIGYVFYGVTDEKLNYSNQYVASYMARLQEVLEYTSDNPLAKIPADIQALVSYRSKVNEEYRVKSQHLAVAFPDFTQASVSHKPHVYPSTSFHINLSSLDKDTTTNQDHSSLTVTNITPIVTPVTLQTQYIDDKDLAIETNPITIAQNDTSAITTIANNSHTVARTSNSNITSDKNPTVNIPDTGKISSLERVTHDVMSDIDLAASLIATHEQEQQQIITSSDATLVSSTENLADEYEYVSYGDIIDEPLDKDTEDPDVALREETMRAIITAQNHQSSTTSEHLDTHSLLKLGTTSVLKTIPDQSSGIVSNSDTLVNTTCTTSTVDETIIDLSLNALHPRQQITSEIIQSQDSSCSTDILTTDHANIFDLTANSKTLVASNMSDASLAEELLSLSPELDKTNSIIHIDSEEVAITPNILDSRIGNLTSDSITNSATTVTSIASSNHIDTNQASQPLTSQIVDRVTTLSELQVTTTLCAATTDNLETTTQDISSLQPISSDRATNLVTTTVPLTVTNITQDITPTDNEVLNAVNTTQRVVPVSESVSQTRDANEVIRDFAVANALDSDSNLLVKQPSSKSTSISTTTRDLLVPEMLYAQASEQIQQDNSYNLENNTEMDVSFGSTTLNSITDCYDHADQVHSLAFATHEEYQLGTPVTLASPVDQNALLTDLTGYSLTQLQQLTLTEIEQLEHKYELMLEPAVALPGFTADTDLGFTEILDIPALVQQATLQLPQYSVDDAGKLVVTPATPSIDTNATITTDNKFLHTSTNTVNTHNFSGTNESCDIVDTVPQDSDTKAIDSLTLPANIREYITSSFSQLSAKLGLDDPEPMYDPNIDLITRLKMMQQNLYLLKDNSKLQRSGLISQVGDDTMVTTSHQHHVYRDSLARQQRYMQHHTNAQVSLPDIAIPKSSKSQYKQAKRLLQQVLQDRKRELLSKKS